MTRFPARLAAALAGAVAIFAAPASADEAFTLRCRVTETEKIDSGAPASRDHVFAATLDLKARKFFVFEESGRKYHSGRIETIHAVAAGSVQLTRPSDFRHGTEHTRASGLQLELGPLVLGEDSVLTDGRMTIETAWRGACEKVTFRPLPAK